MADPSAFAPPSDNGPIPWIVAIGASGPDGVKDTKALLGALPSSLSAAVMVVIHRSWDHQSYLRDILASASVLPVIIVAAGERLQIGTVYIGKPSQHMTLAINGIGELVDDPSRHYGNRTIDLLFHSVAARAGPRAIGVILSGTLDDGSHGLAAIHEAGGITMVLTPSPSPTHEMPANAIDFNGPVDLIGSTASIAQGVSRACGDQIP
jgi:two-component system, chemotaxis family, protein-glutamate methylesterase/glutaminase